MIHSLPKLFSDSTSSRRRGAIKADYLFGAALGLIIILSMVLAVIYTMTPDRDGDEYHYKCEACGEEFVSETAPFMDKGDPNATVPEKIDCPKCGAKKSAHAMVECPECGTYYVRPSYKNPQGMIPQPGQDVCPECGTDYQAVSYTHLRAHET